MRVPALHLDHYYYDFWRQYHGFFCLVIVWNCPSRQLHASIDVDKHHHSTLMYHVTLEQVRELAIANIFHFFQRRATSAIHFQRPFSQDQRRYVRTVPRIFCPHFTQSSMSSAQRWQATRWRHGKNSVCTLSVWQRRHTSSARRRRFSSLNFALSVHTT